MRGCEGVRMFQETDEDRRCMIILCIVTKDLLQKTRRFTPEMDNEYIYQCVPAIVVVVNFIFLKCPRGHLPCDKRM